MQKKLPENLVYKKFCYIRLMYNKIQSHQNRIDFNYNIATAMICIDSWNNTGFLLERLVISMINMTFIDKLTISMHSFCLV